MESQIIRRLFLALKHVVTQTLSGPGEETSKALSSLIQVGPHLGAGGGFSWLKIRGPFQAELFPTCLEVGLGIGGVGAVSVLGGEGKS